MLYYFMSTGCAGVQVPGMWCR